MLQYQCSDMKFSNRSVYNRMFQQVVYKVRDSEINYIKIFHYSKDMEISVVNSYTKDQRMHTFLDNFYKCGNYYAQIASQKS